MAVPAAYGRPPAHSAADAFQGGALIAAAGTLPDAGLTARLRAEHTLMIAADGAAASLAASGILPDVMIGDLDSGGADVERLRSAGVEVIEVADQDRNDLEKALALAAGRGHTRVTVIGAAGGMTDHTLNNFSVMARFADRMRIRIVEDHARGFVLRDGVRLDARAGDRISLIPLPDATLTTSGLVWELRAERLMYAAREGASNRAAVDTIAVEVHTGTVLVLHYPSSA